MDEIEHEFKENVKADSTRENCMTIFALAKEKMDFMQKLHRVFK